MGLPTFQFTSLLEDVWTNSGPSTSLIASLEPRKFGCLPIVSFFDPEGKPPTNVILAHILARKRSSPGPCDIMRVEMLLASFWYRFILEGKNTDNASSLA